MDQAESLRNVIKLKNQMIKPNTRVITITSGKGGVGKSNVAVNLAVWMRRMGKRVLIFDADFGLANVEVMFGAIPQYNISDLIYRGKNIREIITSGPMEIGFVSGGVGTSGMNNLTQGQISLLVNSLRELDEMADIILIDTGAGITDQVMAFVAVSEEILIVTTPDPSSLTDSYSLLKTLYNRTDFNPNTARIDIISNKVGSEEEGRNVYEKLNSVVQQFLHGKIDYLGMIPQDAALEKAVRQQKIISMYQPESNSARAFEIMASNLLNDERKPFRINRGLAKMFSSILRHR